MAIFGPLNNKSFISEEISIYSKTDSNGSNYAFRIKIQSSYIEGIKWQNPLRRDWTSSQSNGCRSNVSIFFVILAHFEQNLYVYNSRCHEFNKNKSHEICLARNWRISCMSRNLILSNKVYEVESYAANFEKTITLEKVCGAKQKYQIRN